MKVAIIGGGLAGIVCAAQLERLGVIPDIYEMNDDLGEPYSHVGVALQIVLRPIKDPLVYLARKYGVSFTPSGLVKKVVHQSPSVCTTIKGKLGYFLHRGAESDSIDKKLAKSLKSNIFLGKKVDYHKIRNRYDYVVIASGYPFEARESGIWQDAIKMSIKGSVICGNFATDTFKVWINKDYCKSGYGYLAPSSQEKASLILAVNDIEQEEIDQYWENFINTENLKYKTIEYFKRVHYAGFVYPHRVENIYFIGNAAGALDPLLGFGVFPTVVTASEAAKSIVYGTDYESQIKDFIALNRRFYEFRKAFNKLDNNGYDFLIRLIGLPGIDALIYKTNINVVSLGYSLLKPLNALIK